MMDCPKFCQKVNHGECEPFAYSLALVEMDELSEDLLYYSYLDFWVIKDMDNLKRILKRRGITANSKNYQIKAFYPDGSWDFVSLKDVCE
jgi:hypothetical protein